MERKPGLCLSARLGWIISPLATLDLGPAPRPRLHAPLSTVSTGHQGNVLCQRLFLRTTPICHAKPQHSHCCESLLSGSSLYIHGDADFPAFQGADTQHLPLLLREAIKQAGAKQD